MALDTSPEALDSRVAALARMWSGYSAELAIRNRAYLRAVSPEFNAQLGEHDQWTDDILPSDVDHNRSSFNLTRSVVELWSALEASEFPAIRWFNAYIPTPVTTGNPQLDTQREAIFQLRQSQARQVATMREQVLMQQVRTSKLPRAFYRWTARKNAFGLSWLKAVPDTRRRRFVVNPRIDPSTVYPVWSGWEDGELDAVLVCYRKSVQSAKEQFPDAHLTLDKTGIAIVADNYYNPTSFPTTDGDRNYVWIEDYWLIDRSYDGAMPDGQPAATRVVNAIRVNGALPFRESIVDGQMVRTYPTVSEYPGWTRVPYFHLENDNLRDHTGFSDAATMLPFQDSTNRFLSQQADVIAGESRPKFKFRGDADRQIELNDEGVIPLDPDEDIEQIAVSLNVFPTQVHGQQLMDVMSRATGLPDVVWGRIVASQNSGRALATAWRAVAARMVPRGHDDAEGLESVLGFMADIMELYDWSSSRELYNGNRDFELDFPNQEPRDFTEVVTAAINKFNAGGLDLVGMMEEWGEKSPDEMLERIRAEAQDPVLHPDKAQAQLFLARMRQQIAIEAQQAQLQAATQVQQMQQASAEQQAAQVQQAQTQAAQQRAPTLTEGQNAPATQAGSPANPAVKSSTLVQDGSAFNRSIIAQ